MKKTIITFFTVVTATIFIFTIPVLASYEVEAPQILDTTVSSVDVELNRTIITTTAVITSATVSTTSTSISTTLSQETETEVTEYDIETDNNVNYEEDSETDYNYENENEDVYNQNDDENNTYVAEEEILYNTGEIDNYSRELLAQICWHEAGSDYISIYEKAQVVSAVMNRVYDERFPSTVYDVLTQDGQFSGYWPDSNGATDECYEAVDYYFENQNEFDSSNSWYGDGTSNYFYYQ